MSRAVANRVVERRRAVARARHYREAEGLSTAQIADRLGRSPATIKAYFYDPTGEKARAVKARYQIYMHYAPSERELEMVNEAFPTRGTGNETGNELRKTENSSDQEVPGNTDIHN
jgi:transcriptional regulator with XRE-family HTH domain